MIAPGHELGASNDDCYLAVQSTESETGIWYLGTKVL